MPTKTWTLTQKIWLLLALSWITGLGSAAFLIYRLKSTAVIFENELHKQDTARVMQLTFKKQVQEWKDVLLRGCDVSALQHYGDAFHQQEKSVAEVASDLRATVGDPEAQAVIDEFTSAHRAMAEKYEAALEVFTKSNGLKQHEADAMVKGQDRAPTDLIDKLVALLAAQNAQMQRAIHRESVLLSWGVLILLAALVLGSVAVTRRMNAALMRTVREINTGAQQVMSAAAQVSASSQTLAQAASEQASSLEETSASTEEINAIAHQNLESARECSRLMARAQEIGKGGHDAAAQLGETMNAINSSSQEVSKILSVIDGIAFQTNILALNAAVEAARAGEAGAGFSVVADEVRNLARRCAEAAKATTELVGRSVASAHDGNSRLEGLNHSLGQSGQIRKEVQDVAETVSRCSAEQTRGIEQISKAIVQMEQTTQSTAASAEQGAAAAEQLVAQSESMKRVIHGLAMFLGNCGDAAIPNVAARGNDAWKHEKSATLANVISLSSPR